MTIAGITENEQKIIEKILNDYNDYKFYYYGSRVKGNFEKTSDLDILIKGEKEMSILELEKLKSEFDKSNLPYVVNFLDYFSINEDFYNIIKSDLCFYK